MSASLAMRIGLQAVESTSSLADALHLAHRITAAGQQAMQVSEAAKITIRGPAIVRLTRDEFDRMWDRLMFHASMLLVDERGPQLGGLGEQLPDEQLARLRRIVEQYWMPTMQVGSPETLMDEAGHLRNVIFNLNLRRLPAPTVITLRRLAESLDEAIREAASAFKRVPAIGTGPKRHVMRRSRIPPLEGLSEIRSGPFAALFFSLEYLTSGDRRRAIRKAKLGAVVDQLASFRAGVGKMSNTRAAVRTKLRKSARRRDMASFIDALRGQGTIVGTEEQAPASSPASKAAR